jgi:hypothetical protein
VIESREFIPRFGGMAGLATATFSVRLGLTHELGELTLVWIGMTGGAGGVAPVISGSWRPECSRALMAIATDDGLMASG